MKLKRCIFIDLFVPTTMPMEQKKRQLSQTVLVHCTGVRVLIEKLCGERKLNLGPCIVKTEIDFGKRFLKFPLTLFGYQSYASSSEPAAYVLQNSGDRLVFLLSARLQNHIMTFRRFGPLLSSISFFHSFL